MIQNKGRIEAAIRHIQTSADIDPWAMELAISALKAQMDGDTISKQNAIDVIRKWKRFETVDGLIERINRLPSAHPEVIRCKDCVHWDTSWQNDYAPNYHYCPMVDGTRKDDFYCADAKPKEEP